MSGSMLSGYWQTLRGIPQVCSPAQSPWTSTCGAECCRTIPRLGADDAQLQVFSSVNKIRVRAPQCRIGVRLSAPISAELVGAYYRSGVRMFATDPEEIRPTALVLGKEALDDAHKGWR